MFSKLKQFLKSGKRVKGDTDESIYQDNRFSDKITDKIDQSDQLKSNHTKVPGTSAKPLTRKTKQGIHRIDSDKDMYDYFNSFEDIIDPDTKNVTHQHKSTLKKKTVKQQRKNKHGMLIIENDDDLFEMMKNGEPDENYIDVLTETGKSPVQGHDSIVRKDRHGIPILDKSDDFRKAFSDDESFADILEQSLGEKTTEVLLKEKRENLEIRKPLTLKQKLKRYPLPQGQLDLHGYTSMKADLKTETYLRHAYSNDIFTVRLIVGKGLHSEDGPVLPDVIEERLIRLRKEKIVLAYEWENKLKSKSGAVTVYLNNVYRDYR